MGPNREPVARNSAHRSGTIRIRERAGAFFTITNAVRIGHDSYQGTASAVPQQHPLIPVIPSEA